MTVISLTILRVCRIKIYLDRGSRINLLFKDWRESVYITSDEVHKDLREQREDTRL